MRRIGAMSVGLVLLLLCGGVASVLAQGTVSGSLQGTIKDAEGGVLPGVTVTALSDALVARRTLAVTDVRGGYRFPSLPPGAYVIEAELSGFGTAHQEGVRIRLGGALSVDLIMQLASVAEQVTVTGEAPVVSVVSNSVSSNIDQDFLQRQPVQRNYYDVIAAAPGVNGLAAYGATQQRQNAFTLDGVNVADPSSGEYWLLPSIQWMQEIQVGGLGADAEYGNYTGGVINAVTKSGGNEVRGEVEFYYEPNNWVAKQAPLDDSIVLPGAGQSQETSLTDLSISVGGPLSKDKLWYFISGEDYRAKTTPYGAVAASDRKIPRYLGKLTYQANAANRLMLMGEYDHVKNENRWIDRYTMPSGAAKQDGPNTTFAASVESLINPANFLTFRVTGFDGRDDYLPYNGWDTPGHYDDGDTGVYTGNLEAGRLQKRQRLAVDTSWSLFKDGFFSQSDSHAFKFGLNYERAKILDDWKRPGGFTYYDDSSLCDSLEAYIADPTCGRDRIRYGTFGSSDEYYTDAKQQGIALYAQDSARFGQVTVNYGVRYTKFEAGFTNGRSDLYKADFFDPRLGLAWDVTGRGRTALKVHWGRYHMAMFTYLYDRETSGHSAKPAYECYWDPETQQYGECDEPVTQAARLDPDHGHQYVDEALLTFEQQLGRNMSIGVDLIDRRTREIMAMVNANQDYTLTTVTGNPFGGTLPIYNLGSQPDFLLTTNNGAYRDYQSAVLRFDKRYADGWLLRASLVWADLKGNIFSNSGYDVDYMDKNGLTNLSGKMEGYSKLEFKLSGSVDLPLGLQYGASYTYLSGEYWTPYARIYGLDYNSSTGNYIYLTPRGSQQLPDRNLVDMKLGWSTMIASGLKLGLSLEGFNVLNKSTPLAVSGRWGYYDDTEDPAFVGPRPAYGTITSMETPRELRLGIKLEF